MGLWSTTPVGTQCFDLLDYMFFQALGVCLLIKGWSLAGPSQEESFGGDLSPAFAYENRDSCSPKAVDASQHLAPLVKHCF